MPTGQAPRETLIHAMLEDGPTLTASAEALLVPNYIVPARTIQKGTILRATLIGIMSNVVTTPGTRVLRVRWGGLTGTILAQQSFTQSTVAETDRTFIWTQYIICTDTGALTSVGYVFRGNQAVQAVGDMVPDLVPTSGAAAPEAVTLTADTALSFTASSSVATASITCEIYFIERIA